MKKRIMTAGMLAMILAMGMTACANADTKEKSTTKKEQVSESDEKKEQKMSDNEANVMNEKRVRTKFWTTIGLRKEPFYVFKRTKGYCTTDISSNRVCN